MKVPYVELGVQYQNEKKDILPIIDNVLSKGNYILGEEVDKLETTLAKFCGVKYCVTFNSGTDALLVSLYALGVRKGDEVITQPNSFIASAAVIAHIGAKPVFVDVACDQSIDVSKIEEAITKKTKAIMPVHLTGRIGEMDKLKKISQKYTIPIIEDAAQSIGSCYGKTKSGAFGEVGCFSTHPLKNLNAMGDGGFLTTNTHEIYKIAKLYRNHGLENRNKCVFWGSVSRLDEVQAAILNYRFTKLEDIIDKRIANAKIYHKNLNQEKIYIPEIRNNTLDTFHTFVIQVKKRDELQKYLLSKDIFTSIHYPTPIHLQPSSKYLGHKVGDFPVTESQAKEIISLPINQNLSQNQINYVIKTVNEFVKYN